MPAAQSSADQAQSTANQGVATEQAAGALAAENTVAAQTLNQRMSDLGNHVTVDSLKFTFWGTGTLPVK